MPVEFDREGARRFLLLAGLAQMGVLAFLVGYWLPARIDLGGYLALFGVIATPVAIMAITRVANRMGVPEGALLWMRAPSPDAVGIAVESIWRRTNGRVVAAAFRAWLMVAISLVVLRMAILGASWLLR